MPALALLVFLPAFSASAQTDGRPDLLGWGPTRWGMEEDQVRRLLGDDAVALEPPATWPELYASFKLPIQVGEALLEVLPQFSAASARLEQVLIQRERGDADLFKKLKDLLTIKYGEPLEIGERFEWRFKSTVVELTSQQRRLGATLLLGAIEIRYYPAARYHDEGEML